MAPAPSAAPTSPAPATPPAEGEIKHVTVFYGELVCSAPEAPGPELMHRLLGRFFELAKAEIQRFGGTVSQFLGRGFMALFGAPVAYEDHARRGVLTALGLQDRLAEQAAEVEARLGVRWGARMGLDTGPVVVGGLGGMAVGETTQRAENLQQQATAGTILISDDTARLVRAHVELKAAGQEVWQVVSGSGFGAIWRFQGTSSSPFVGRARELQALEELRELAAGGQGQLVGLLGEAGAGKSRLLHEFYLRTFLGRRLSYLRGQCLSYGSGVPYMPFIDMIRKASRISETDDATIAAKVCQSLEKVDTDVEETLPYLLRMMGVRKGTEALDQLEPQAIQTRTFAALRRMLFDAAQRSLVIIELEDLHWIDRTSEEFLSSLAERMAAARMLLIVTYRAGYQPPWLDKSYATQITLRRLSADDSRELITSILARAELPQDLGGDLFEKAEGNPFFLEELARAVVDRGAEGDSAVPDTIHGVLMARIDRLPEQHKHLLRTGAVLGREISLELLQAIWDRPEPPEPLLEELQRWEFVHRAPSEQRTAFYFKHALTQEVVYRSLLSSRRQELHRQVAEALEKRYAGHLEDAYDRLIYHYPRADQSEKTVHYLTQFATRAARDYAHAEAAKALREALDHSAKLPAEERDRRRIEVLLQLADSLLPLASFPETLELFQRFTGSLEGIDEPSLRAQYYFWLAHTHTYLGNQEETRDNALLSIRAAKECGDETTEGKACYVLGRDGFWSGQFSEGIKYSLQAVVLLERSGEPWWQGQAYWVAGFNHYVLGQFDEALEALRRAYSIGEALDDYRLDTSWSIGYFYASLGEAEAGIEQCRNGLERSQDPLNSAVAMGFLGYALLQKPDLPAAIESLEESVARLRRTGMQQILGWFSAFLAEAYLQTDRSPKARQTAAEGLEITRGAKFRYGEGLAQRVLGCIAIGDAQLDEAAEHLEDAVETFRSLEVPFEVGRTQLELARLASARGHAEIASQHLSASHGLFTELHVPQYAERVAALAAELRLPPPS